MSRPWRIKEPDPKMVDELAAACKVNRLLAKCILNRNLRRVKEIDLFLKPESYRPADPYLIPDMAKAVDRIVLAIEQGEKICIYGDYDADGVTAIAILSQVIRDLQGEVFYYIPDRFFEGVGLNAERLGVLKRDKGVGLVITVDTGVRSIEEMAAARDIGLDIIITDHHTPDETQPDAFALLNPKLKHSQYPFKHLCGAGVAFKIAQALDNRFPDVVDISMCLQIAAIGTVADMVPLREENRWIVVQGLKAIDQQEKGPIRALMRRLGLRGKVTALDISYKVAPRINAPGRLGDPDVAISFFNQTNPRETARNIDIMDGMNTIRQMLEREVEAKMEVQLRHSIRGEAPPFVMVAGRHWHRGILGIMACKLLRRYNRPSCVLSFDSETAHGSMRGVPGVNLLDVLEEIAPLMTSFGGHPEAAGVTLPVTNIPQFKSRLTELFARTKDEQRSEESTHAIDAILNWGDIDDKRVFENMRRMAPFGIGNSAPVFLSANLILETELLRRGPWFHFEASDGEIQRKCSFYHPTELNTQFEKFDSVDLVYSLTPFRNEYQVQILEMKPSMNNS